MKFEDIEKKRDAFSFMCSRGGPRTIAVLITALVLFKYFLFGWDFVDVGFVFLLFMLRALIEWPIHRYILHASPVPVLGVRIKSPLYYMHVSHHKFPHDIETFLFKGKSIFFVFLIMLILSSLALRGLDMGLVSTLAFMLVLLNYEFFHVLSHSKINPQSGYLKTILLLHRDHHNVNPSRNYGVSSPLVDSIGKIFLPGVKH